MSAQKTILIIGTCPVKCAPLTKGLLSYFTGLARMKCEATKVPLSYFTGLARMKCEATKVPLSYFTGSAPSLLPS
jgi:hypothetical protein